MNDQTGQVLNSRLSLHYRETGDPAGPAVVLIHGGRDHGRTWDPVAQDLSRDWRVIIPDLRGHGDSDHSSDGHYPMDAFVADLDALIEGLSLAKVRLVGHSLGGNIALRYAGICPERVERLVAIEGLGAAPDLRRARDEEAIGPRMKTWIEARRLALKREHRRYSSIAEAALRMAAAQPQLDPSQVEHLTNHGLRRNTDGTFSWKYDKMLWADPAIDVTTEQMESFWQRIECPVLLVYGKDSWASDPSRDGRAAHFKNATVSMYEGAGHWVHYDRHDKFIAELRAFLA